MKPDVYKLVADAVEKVGMARLKPIFEELGGKIAYEEIRLVVSHLQDTHMSPAIRMRGTPSMRVNEVNHPACSEYLACGLAVTFSHLTIYQPLF